MRRTPGRGERLQYALPAERLLNADGVVGVEIEVVGVDVGVEVVGVDIGAVNADVCTALGRSDDRCPRALGRLDFRRPRSS